jgi:hypothetical protein
MNHDIINHDIVFKKLWEDNELIELEVTCSSPVITAKTQIYVVNDLIDELIYKINLLVSGTTKEVLWECGSKGNDSTACVCFRFLNKDKLGHVYVETYLELDDDARDYDKHNCCFFVNTEQGMLINFARRITQLKNGCKGHEVHLNI